MKTETEKMTGSSGQLIPKEKLVLFNDDFNTFDFVIETLVDLCGHDPLQAEQCATIVHYKGKCEVKHGERQSLEPLCRELLRRGLSARIIE